MSKYNERFELWRELHPEAPVSEYPFWIKQKIRELVEAKQWDIVTDLGGGSIRDQDAFTDFLKMKKEQ